MAAGTIKMMCPNLRCRAILGVPAEARGKTVRCRNCGGNIKIPQKRAAPVVQQDDSGDQAGESSA